MGLADADLKKTLKAFRADPTLYNGMPFEKIRNEKAKRAILGIGFGLGAEKLFNMNQDSFANKAEAKKIQDLIKELFPKVFKFQGAIREKAYRQGYLDNRWGFRRYFWDVYHWDSRRGSLVPGNDAEACIAYLPSSGAFGMLRAVILRLEERGLLERYGFCNTVHDSVLFHCRLDRALECIDEVLTELQSPCIELADPLVAPNGFTCGAEASIGFNWAEMYDAEKFFANLNPKELVA